MPGSIKRAVRDPIEASYHLIGLPCTFLSFRAQLADHVSKNWFSRCSLNTFLSEYSKTCRNCTSLGFFTAFLGRHATCWRLARNGRTDRIAFSIQPPSPPPDCPFLLFLPAQLTTRNKTKATKMWSSCLQLSLGASHFPCRPHRSRYDFAFSGGTDNNNIETE